MGKRKLSTCFPPIATAQSRVLILGSMPGEKSLAENQYYAHPQNAFWPLMAALFGRPVDIYAQCVRLIEEEGLALWDVLEKCSREGSLDTEIKDNSIVVNDFVTFFAAHPRITHVFFNGTKAEKEFMKRVQPHLPPSCADLTYARLPSTSPAMATLSREKKAKAWQQVVVALKK